MKWKDITSYSRNEPEPRTPRVFEMRLSHIRLVAIFDHIYHRKQWCVEVAPFDRDPEPIEAKTAEEAKAAAITRAHSILADVRQSLSELE